MDDGAPVEWEGGGEPWGALDGDNWGPEVDGGMGRQPWGDSPPPDWERRGRGPPEGDGRHPWGPTEEGIGGRPWVSHEIEGGPPPENWGPSEEGLGGRPWGPSDIDDRPPPEREGRGEFWGPPERGSREPSWGSPERKDWGHEPSSQRNGRGPLRGSPRRIMMSPPRESWDPPPETVWRGPDPEMHRSRLPSSLGWEPHRGDLTSRWGSPREEAREELPPRGNQAPLRGQGPFRPRRARSQSPAEGREWSHPMENLKRTRWDGPEGRERGQVIPSRRQVGQDGPEGLRRPQDSNREYPAWREGSRDHSYFTRQQLQRDSMGIAGPWSGPGEMEGEPPGPPRQEWGWDSPSRPNWQTREERDCYSPKWEERQEHFKGQSPLDLDQGHGNLGGGRWSSSEQRGRGHPNQYSGDIPTESPHRQRHPEGHLAGFRGGWGPEGGRVDRGSPERDWKKEEGHGGDGEDLDTKAFTSRPATFPKEWTPCEQVLSYWARCRTVLKKKSREYMLSTCPRPTLPDRSSETPQLNSSITAMLKPQQQKEVAYASRSLHALQDKVLDMLAPAMTIYEMAEEALEKGEAVDPRELREWARRLVRYIGSISQSLTLQRRVVVLGAIHPRLKCVTTKMNSQSTDGLLFAEDKVKLLKEIIKKFPQLAQAPRRAHPFVRPSYSNRRAPVRSGAHHLHGAGKPYGRSPADQHEEHH